MISNRFKYCFMEINQQKWDIIGTSRVFLWDLSSANQMCLAGKSPNKMEVYSSWENHLFFSGDVHVHVSLPEGK